MSSETPSLRITRVPSESLYPELLRVSVFAELKLENLQCLGTVEVIDAAQGTEILPMGSPCESYFVLLEGEVEIHKLERAGEQPRIFTHLAGDAFGEVPLLKGSQSNFAMVASQTSRLVRFDEQSFWQLMSSCPRVRAAILGNMARRLESYQASAVHREKLASLGTMAAGLMHELNNPGAAALRAASQLREKLSRLQEISLRFTRTPITPEQLACMAALQEHALRKDCCVLMNSLEQSDREEALATWLEAAGVENAWRLAPALAEMGMDEERLECARTAFTGQKLSDVLNWLEVVISSSQLVSTLESSIARVTDLVVAVKKFAYDGKGAGTALNIHESLHSTIVILGHKLRHKGIVLRKDFDQALPALEGAPAGLSQVWTNLLDNAIDASPEGGEIRISTRRDGERVAISIADHGTGIPEENQKRIFEPFFTTKPIGAGTGLGLDIASRIVDSTPGGEIAVESSPAGTTFTVYLPLVSSKTRATGAPSGTSAAQHA